MSVTFDTDRRLIIEDDTGLSTNILRWDEIYSAWKEWMLLPGNAGFDPVFRTVGGDEISATKALGVTLFLLNGWRFKPAEYSHNVVLEGNAYTDPSGDSVSVSTDGQHTVLVTNDVSLLVESERAEGNVPRSVWEEVIEDNYTAEGLLRVIAAVLAGRVSGAGTGTETFKGVDDSTDRVISVVDNDGNRTQVTLDVS